MKRIMILLLAVILAVTPIGVHAQEPSPELAQGSSQTLWIQKISF
jgi:hypothetical protein